jgi:hypothetical protein
MHLLLTPPFPVSVLLAVGALAVAVVCLAGVAWSSHCFKGYSRITRSLLLTGVLGGLMLGIWSGAVNFQTFRETTQVRQERLVLDQNNSELEERSITLVKDWSTTCDDSARVKQETETAKLRVAELERQVTEMAALESENQAIIKVIPLQQQKLLELREAARLDALFYEEFSRTRHALEDQLEHKISQMHILRNELEERALREP